MGEKPLSSSGDAGSVFVQTLNPMTGKTEWAMQPEDYDYKQEVARAGFADMLHDSERVGIEDKLFIFLYALNCFDFRTVCTTTASAPPSLSSGPRGLPFTSLTSERVRLTSKRFLIFDSPCCND